MVSDNKPLYELETVAARFGGNQVKKILVANGGASPAVTKRAEEMDIMIKRHL